MQHWHINGTHSIRLGHPDLQPGRDYIAKEGGVSWTPFPGIAAAKPFHIMWVVGPPTEGNGANMCWHPGGATRHWCTAESGCDSD